MNVGFTLRPSFKTHIVWPYASNFTSVPVSSVVILNKISYIKSSEYGKCPINYIIDMRTLHPPAQSLPWGMLRPQCQADKRVETSPVRLSLRELTWPWLYMWERSPSSKITVFKGKLGFDPAWHLYPRGWNWRLEKAVRWCELWIYSQSSGRQSDSRQTRSCSNISFARTKRDKGAISQEEGSVWARSLSGPL